jgi:hypothetical protein
VKRHFAETKIAMKKRKDKERKISEVKEER